MPKRILTMVLFFGVAVAATLLVSHATAQAVDEKQVKEWEYLTESSNGTKGLLSLERLNEFGSDGWELVELCPKGEYSYHYVFKRPSNSKGAK